MIDIIPADYVGNFMIALSLVKSNKKGHFVYNLSTTSLNPLRIGTFMRIIESYWNQNPPRDRKGSISISLYEK